MVVTVQVNERCLARSADAAYELVTVLKVNKKSARVKYLNGVDKTLPFDHLWKLKKKKRGARTSQFCKSGGNDAYTPRSRNQRFALVRYLAVQPVCYGHGFKNGDFHHILSDDAVRRRVLCIFNDNTDAWERHGMCPDEPQGMGGGNACARPWQHRGDSIGMPTGPFANLAETRHVTFAGEPASPHTAKEIIDEATQRIVRLLVQHPAKDTIFYSVDSPDSTKIGLAIFRGCVGDDVVEYITKKIADLPRAVRLARRDAC